MKKGIFKPKYSKNEVSQKFNLKELLGYSPSERQKELFFTLAVEKMQERTTDGKDINGKRFKKYSAEYAAQKGVTRDSVDLVLTGEMLESFEESQVNQRNMVKIKVGEGVNTKKSFNHNVGDTLPKRTHFGVIQNQEINQIIDEVDRAKDQRVDLAALRAAIQSVTVEQIDE